MQAGMKTEPEMIEGPEALANFRAAMTKIMTVSKDELLRREAEYRKQSLANPNRRGPKPKAKRRRASRAPGASTPS